MNVYLMGAGSGDPELLTVKAWKYLQSATVCLVSFRSLDPRLREIIPVTTQLINVSHASLDDMLLVYQELVNNQQDFVHLFAGDPCLYEPLSPCVTWLTNHKVNVEVVAGISAHQALAAQLSCELTMFGVSQSVVITRIKGDCQMPSQQELTAFASSRSTLCVYFANKYPYEGWKHLETYYGKMCPAVVGINVNRTSEKIEKITVGELADYFSHYPDNTHAPMVVLIGEALSQSI